jgi:uncharacterized protein (DUF58 family)
MLTPDEVRQLDRLSLGSVAVPPTPGLIGARVARVRGYGADLHDYRRYEPGDDPRTIDWNIYARLRQLVVRVSRADAHVVLHLLLDSSRSMAIGAPDKLSCAKRLAAALAYIALQQHDRVAVAAFDHSLRERVGPGTGRLHARRVLDVLAGLTPAGRSSTGSALRDYGASAHGPGLAVVLSDFFEDDDPRAGLRQLLRSGIVPAVVQVVADEELDPSIDGEVELLDIEQPDLTPVLVDGRSVAEYRLELRRLAATLVEFCATHGVPWMQVRSSHGFGQLLQSCVSAHLLARRG